MNISEFLRQIEFPLLFPNFRDIGAYEKDEKRRKIEAVSKNQSYSITWRTV